MPHLDLTPAAISLPHDLRPGTKSQGRYWPLDFRPWLTREAIADAAELELDNGDLAARCAAADWLAWKYDQ